MPTDSLASLRHTLTTLASELVIAMPDLQQMARDQARDLLASLGLEENPDSVYWHRFDNAQSSHRSFTGYAHQGPPVESLTFTQLFMRRFRVADQDNVDLLQVMGGFYREDQSVLWFDERNEVRLLPDRVLGKFWELDFSANYHQLMTVFWQRHTPNIQMLARINCLAAAVEACQHRELDRQQVQWVAQGLGVTHPMALTLEDLKGASTDTTALALSIAGYEFPSLVCFVAPDGQRMLYMAGRHKAFERFADQASTDHWLYQQACHDDALNHLLVHGRLLGTADAATRASTLRHLADTSLTAFAAKVAWSGSVKNVGAWLTEQSRLQMQQETDLLLHGNADLRKQLWIGYLSAGLRVLGPGAMTAWPIAVLAVVASASKMALLIDQAVSATDSAGRRAAVLGAIMSGVELLMNMTLLIPGALPVVDEIEPLTARPVLEAEQPPLPRSDGILTIEGENHIRLDGRLYRVRYDPDLGCWLVIDPKRPFAFSGNYPVRFNEQLDWELLEPACLRGGGQCLGVRPVAVVPPADYAEFDAMPGHYEVPDSARQATRELLDYNMRRMLSGEYYNPDSPLNPVLDSLNRLRARIIEDATQFIRQWRTSPRTDLPLPDPQVPPGLALRRLLDESRGVVIAESHQAVASKKFLIDNMRALARNGVNTLYMEHLLTDLHQAELGLLPRSGRLPDVLSDYLRDLDIGQRLDPLGDYTFTKVVQAAAKEGIQVRALDCAASYRLDGIEDLYEVGGTLRQQVFSYYASNVIRGRQALPGSGKWIAFVGDTHASTYKRVPGLAQLEDVPSIRVVDAGEGQQTNMTLDPGEYYLPSIRRPDGVVRADWRVAIKVREEPFQYRDPSLAPPGVLRP